MYILCYLQDYVEAIEELPEFDKPSYFGLPENIERSAQRIISNQVIGQLKVLQRADAKANKFDKEIWATELGPILNLWKKLNQVRLDTKLKKKILLMSPRFFFVRNFVVKLIYCAIHAYSFDRKCFFDIHVFKKIANFCNEEKYS